MKDKCIENLTAQFKTLLNEKNTVEKENLRQSSTIDELQNQIDQNSDVDNQVSAMAESRKKAEEDHQTLIKHLNSVKQQ
jgi:hypothetical protein